MSITLKIYFFAPVAQWLEHRSYKPGVAGSNPAWRSFLPTANCQLLNVNCQLLIANCQLKFLKNFNRIVKNYLLFCTSRLTLPTTHFYFSEGCAELAKAPVLKTGGLTPLWVRVPHPPLFLRFLFLKKLLFIFLFSKKKIDKIIVYTQKNFIKNFLSFATSRKKNTLKSVLKLKQT